RQQAPRGQELRKRSDHAAGVEQRTQAGLGVIAEESADLAKPGIDRFTTEQDANRSVVVPQVAELRAGAEVDPLAAITMADEAVVILVDIALENAGLALAADTAFRPNAAASHGPAADMRSRADVARAFQPAERLDHRL